MPGHGSPSLVPTQTTLVAACAQGIGSSWWLRGLLAGILCSLWTPAFSQQLELGNPQGKPSVPSPAVPSPGNQDEAPIPALGTVEGLPANGSDDSTETGTTELVDLNLRLAWGGGRARAWQGQIQINQGKLTLIRGLGMEADQARAVMAEGQIIHIQQLAANTFHGIDISVQAPKTATLFVVLTTTEQEAKPRTLKVPIASLIQETSNFQLDQEENRIQIHRTPGDQLRLNFKRDSLVFSPQESFPLTVEAHQLGLPAGTSLRCEVHFQGHRTGKTISKSNHDLTVSADGKIPPLGPLTFEIPDVEGVYDLHVALYQKSLTDTFLPGKPLHQRSLQLVVIAPEPEAPEPMPDFTPNPDEVANHATWSTILAFDPANPTWWKRFTQIPKLSMIPGIGNGPINNGKITRVQRHGKTLTQLGPGGWVAFPLPLDQLETVHLLELDYPQDMRQTLSISIIDPNLAGKVAPIGLDSGIDVTTSRQSATATMAAHRLPFWPRTKTPWVLLVNRHAERPASFGSLRVLQGLRPLPAATENTQRPSQRLITAYFDKPLFPENFGAREGIDAVTRSSLDDWNTFYDGGDRLSRYLRFAGYNAAVVTVLCEGAALYPSVHLDGTPKYDSGIFFTTGQDPVRKDVLEMLLRKFDQRGLKLIPAIQFSSPLLALEKQLRQDPSQAVGIELLGPQGKSWTDTRGTRRGMAPYYNPLDPRVQQEIHRVIDELVERYQHHRSFGGLAIQMSSETYSQLPGPQWGTDQQTFDRFIRHADPEAENTKTGLQERLKYINGPNRQKWLKWRGQVLADFYQQVSDRLKAKNPDSRLYLVTTDLVNSSNARKQLQPRLPQQNTLADVLLEAGIDHQRFGDSDHLVLLRPQRLAPSTSLTSQGSNLVMETSPQVDQLFANDKHSGQLFYHEPQSLSLPDFDKQSPFGAEHTQTWLVSHFAPAGIDNRRQFIHAIATSDIQTLMHGGWMLPVGQEDSFRELFTTFQRLPKEKFTTVDTNNDKKTTQPVVVRTLKTNSETYIYLVNDSSWPVEVEIQVDAHEQCLVMPLGNHAVSNLQRSPNGTTWTVRLNPYDLVAASFTSAAVNIQNVRVRYDQKILEDLRREIYAMNYRISGLNKPKPINVVRNASFEFPLEQQLPPGWIHNRKHQENVQLDRTVVLDGRQSLHLKRTAANTDVVWVRSKPFAPPKTGRIAISAWLKVKDEKKQPALRLAIEGRQFGKVYYRPKTIGKNEPGNQGPVKPIREKWTEFLLLIDDLPARGLTELRVGFDLMSEGEVWIDNIKVYDLWFQESEKRELLKHVALAYTKRNELKVADCEHFLTSYWAKFLTRHVPMNQARVANLPAKATTPAAATAEAKPTQPDALTPKPPPSMIDRVKDWIPKKVFPF